MYSVDRVLYNMTNDYRLLYPSYSALGADSRWHNRLGLNPQPPSLNSDTLTTVPLNGTLLEHEHY